MPEEKLAKVKKKEWFPLIATPAFREAFLGETLIADKKQALGKIIDVNVMALEHDIKKQSMVVRFKVDAVKEDSGIAEVIGFHLMPSSIRRFIRPGKKRIDLSFVCITSDNRKLRVKVLMLVNITTRSSAILALEKNAIDFISKEIKKMPLERLVLELVATNLQKALKSHLRKLYPLRICELTYVGLEKEKRHAAVIKEEEAGAEEARREAAEEAQEAQPEVIEGKKPEKEPEKIEEKAEEKVEEEAEAVVS